MDESMCRMIVKEGLYDLSRPKTEVREARLANSPSLVIEDQGVF